MPSRAHSLAEAGFPANHPVMSARLPILISALAVLLTSCASSRRSPFQPESGPITVGMPAELSERERLFVPDIEVALRREGMLPVRGGSGEYQLDFQMAEGPIRTDTRIELKDGRRVIARGNGRAAGAPLVGRSGVAESSFGRAFETFEEQLQSHADRRAR
jgi:hypothetical protein